MRYTMNLRQLQSGNPMTEHCVNRQRRNFKIDSSELREHSLTQ